MSYSGGYAPSKYESLFVLKKVLISSGFNLFIMKSAPDYLKKNFEQIIEDHLSLKTMFSFLTKPYAHHICPNFIFTTESWHSLAQWLTLQVVWVSWSVILFQNKTIESTELYFVTLLVMVINDKCMIAFEWVALGEHRTRMDSVKRIFSYLNSKERTKNRTWLILHSVRNWRTKHEIMIHSFSYFDLIDEGITCRIKHSKTGMKSLYKHISFESLDAWI